MNFVPLTPPVMYDPSSVSSATKGQVAGSSSASAALKANRLLRTLPANELTRLISGGRWVTLKQDEVISRQSDPVEVVLFIAEGRAKAEISAPVRAGYKAVVNFLGPGDDIGLLSLVDGAPHSASVIALEDVHAVAVPVTVVRDYLNSHPEWYRVLAEIAVSRLRTSGLWLQALI